MSRVSTRWKGMRSEACDHGACYDCRLDGCDHRCHAEDRRVAVKASGARTRVVTKLAMVVALSLAVLVPGTVQASHDGIQQRELRALEELQRQGEDQLLRESGREVDQWLRERAREERELQREQDSDRDRWPQDAPRPLWR